jgi:hypothetical protein
VSSSTQLINMAAKGHGQGHSGNNGATGGAGYQSVADTASAFKRHINVGKLADDHPLIHNDE